MDKFESDIKEITKSQIPVSLSDLDVMRLVKGKAKVLLYKDLAKYNTIDEALGKHGALYLLYEAKPMVGHWVTVFKRDDNTISYFCSYGTFPDQQLYWNNQYTRDYLGQNIPYLSYLLINSQYEKLEYNDFAFQKPGKDVATCGRWAAMRLLLRELTPEEFIKAFRGVDGDYLVTLITEII